MKNSGPVVFVTNSLSGGGAERAMNQVVNSLFHKGIPTMLITINSGESDLIEVICPHVSINRKWRANVFQTFFSFLKFQRFILRIKPSIVVLNCDLPEFFGGLALGRQMILVVEHVANPWHTRVLFGRAIRFLLNVRSAKWVTVSNHYEPWNASVTLCPHIPNPIYSDNSRSCTQDFPAIESTKRIVFVGRLLKEQKRPDWILEICSSTGLPGLIIGDGTFKTELENRSRDLKLEIEFLGAVKNPWEFLDKGDVLIVPSAWEGDGLVVIEAISKNIPILLSDISDFRRFGFGDKHYCHTPLDFGERLRSFRGQINSLIVEPKIVEEILRKRDIDVVCSQWIQLFRNLGIVKTG